MLTGKSDDKLRLNPRESWYRNLEEVTVNGNYEATFHLKRRAVTVLTRNIPPYRDAAVILIDQLKEIYTDGVLEAVDTTQWYPRLMRQGLHGRPQCQRDRSRRPRPAVLRKLCLRGGAQLHRLLQPRGRQVGRSAIGGSRQGKTQAHRLRD